MAGFKPKSTVRPSQEELLATVGRVSAEVGHLPTSPELVPAPRLVESPPRPATGPGPTVLVNFKATLAFAKLIAEVSEREGGVRRMLARMLKEAGHDVPERDLNPVVKRRKYE
jgi:hypothetical protein